MVGKTELFLICLVAVALLAIVARKIRVPYPILLTIGGVGLALFPLRGGRCHDRRLFAGAGELAVSPRGRGRDLCWSRDRLARDAGTEAFGRSARTNHVLPPYSVRCLFQR